MDVGATSPAHLVGSEPPRRPPCTSGQPIWLGAGLIWREGWVPGLCRHGDGGVCLTVCMGVAQ